MAWKTLDDMDLNGKKVLTRVDINVPMDGPVVTDATRIEKIVPTVKTILAAGGLPILLAHFGRPKGKVVPEMSLGHLIPALKSALQAPVAFAEDCNGPKAQAAKLSQSAGLISVAGGGDTVAALNKAGAAQGFSYISTAGGAFLEWMEGKTLPGVAALL